MIHYCTEASLEAGMISLLLVQLLKSLDKLFPEEGTQPQAISRISNAQLVRGPSAYSKGNLHSVSSDHSVCAYNGDGQLQTTLE